MSRGFTRSRLTITRGATTLLAIALLSGALATTRPTPHARAAGEPTIANTELWFDEVTVGTTSYDLPVYVYNYTGAPLAITSSGGDPSDSHFAKTDNCNGDTLADLSAPYPDYQCTIEYTFTPDAPGTYLATATLTVNGTPHVIYLAGKGAAANGTITGSITLDNAAPGSERNVYVTTLDGSQSYQFHNEPNPYSVDVPPGQYCVSFGIGPWDGTVVSYPGRRHCLDSITPVMVTSGATTPNIDATLTFGSIAGTLRDARGALLPGEYVYSQVVGGTSDRSSATDGAGAYTLDNLVPGTYCVGLGTNDAADGPCVAGRRRVDVPAGVSVTGVDIELAASVPDEGPPGAITGTVTGPGSVAQAGREVVAEALDEFGWGNSATTAADGTYSIDGLSAGAYCVFVLDDGSPLAGEYYDDKASCAEADVVLVTDTATSGIDFELATGATLSVTSRSPMARPPPPRTSWCRA